jgi:hypothetical protein
MRLAGWTLIVMAVMLHFSVCEWLFANPVKEPQVEGQGDLMDVKDNVQQGQQQPPNGGIKLIDPSIPGERDQVMPGEIFRSKIDGHRYRKPKDWPLTKEQSNQRLQRAFQEQRPGMDFKEFGPYGIIDPNTGKLGIDMNLYDRDHPDERTFIDKLLDGRRVKFFWNGKQWEKLWEEPRTPASTPKPAIVPSSISVVHSYQEPKSSAQQSSNTDGWVEHCFCVIGIMTVVVSIGLYSSSLVRKYRRWKSPPPPPKK